MTIKRQPGGGRPESIACMTAIVQAMHYVFHVPNWQIAELTGVAATNVSSLTVSSSTPVLCWWERKHQAEAITAAHALLRAGK